MSSVVRKIHMEDPDGRQATFVPGVDLPEWAAARLRATNPRLLDDYTEPVVEPAIDTDAESAPLAERVRELEARLVTFQEALGAVSITVAGHKTQLAELTTAPPAPPEAAPGQAAPTEAVLEKPAAAAKPAKATETTPAK